LSCENNSKPIWDIESIEKVLETRHLPKPNQQIDYVLQWLGNQSNYFGHGIEAKYIQLMGFAGCFHYESIHTILEALSESELIRYIPSTGASSAGSAELTISGWEQYEKLLQFSENSDNAFMAMKFGDSDLETLLQEHL
jgi:hypothetical protein